MSAGKSIHEDKAEQAQDTQQALGLSLLWNYTLSFIKSMGLKCAVELRIPDAILHHGKPATVSDLLSSLSLPDSKSRCLGTLMRLLSVQGIFKSHTTLYGEETFDLTSVSRLLTTTEPSGPGVSPMILTFVDHHVVNPYQQLSRWFRRQDSEAMTIFEMLHGKTIWDFAGALPAFNDLFNEAMAGDSALIAEIITRSGREIFQGITTLVDVGGGTGMFAATLAEAFPDLKCTVLDLPHVVETAQKRDGIRFVGGDMFVDIPPADAVLLKWILHDWNDDDCIKILQCCRKAIPPKDKGGKVILIEMVVGCCVNDQNLVETQLLIDLKMMVLHGGKERDEGEWHKLFVSAGFSDYKIIMSIDLRSIIEVYP